MLFNTESTLEVDADKIQKENSVNNERNHVNGFITKTNGLNVVVVNEDGGEGDVGEGGSNHVTDDINRDSALVELKWCRERLEGLGLRSLSNGVEISKDACDTKGEVILLNLSLRDSPMSSMSSVAAMTPSLENGDSWSIISDAGDVKSDSSTVGGE